ncbi:hypothetical protein HB779_13400 [Phyllobacterium sp. 628]|uniref:hypothetical protein n=1 Tax=Phyllobacterium sp. 628 TaxID=2718938 RepID=UPI0016622E54|nr:hypothetical protein [Phyllobacterium sp. 628]QND52789.1 hypothetical protein HB779_13400 [Phyllobacterium sp. 628]
MNTGIFDTIDDLDDAADAIRAFNEMLVHTVQTGTDISRHARGMYLLLGQQSDGLDGALTAVRGNARALLESKLACRDFDQIAQWTGLSRKVVETVVGMATGIRVHNSSAPSDANTNMAVQGFNEAFGDEVAHANTRSAQ